MSEDIKKPSTSGYDKKVSKDMIRFCVVALTLATFFLVSNAAYAADTSTTDHSTGAWTSFNVATEVVPGYELQFNEQYRYSGADSSENHTDIRVGKKIRNWTGIVGYKNVFGEEHRPYFGFDIAFSDFTQKYVEKH